MNGTQKSILGFLIGAAAGAIAGILLAPDSGEQTRQKIATKAKDYSGDLGSQLNTAIEKLNQYVAEAKSKAQSIASEVKAKAENVA